MNLIPHLAFTGAAVVALAPFREGGELALFAAGGVLIDVDHYFFYIRRTGRFDIRGMFRYFYGLQRVEQNLPYAGLCLFHTLDFFLAVWLISLKFPVLLPLLAGLLFHFLLDLADLIRKKVLFIRPYTLIEHLVRRRREGYPYY